MAGYSCDYSKSNNALEAEASGQFPASIIAKKLRVPIAAVRAAGACAWHHTSSWYNRVDYYSLDDVREFLDTDDGQAALAAAVITRTAPAPLVLLIGATVTWLEWSGSRNHPRATEHRVSGCTVVFPDPGKTTFTIVLPDGTFITKRRDTRGFAFDGGERLEVGR